MEIKFDANDLSAIEQSLSYLTNPREARKWIDEYSKPYRELMAFYQCAIMEIETKFKVLNTQFSLGNDNNPIESIRTRLKSPHSIFDKMQRLGLPFTVDSIEQNMHDIAGVRVICSTISDIYMLADALLKQDDITLIEKKDYFANPKKNGYRSMHLIVSVPIFLQDRKKMMKVEVQLRTLAMDAWASLEHKILYKKDVTNIEAKKAELKICADLCSEFDIRMEQLKNHR